MRHPPIHNLASSGLLVWKMHGSAAMARPHIHADLEINIPLEGKPLRYLRAGRIFEVPVGRMVFFWGGIPHQLLAPADRCSGVWMTLPLAMAFQWDLPGKAVRQALAGEVFMESAFADCATPTLRWVEDFKSGEPSRRRVMLLEIESRIRRMLLYRSKSKKPSLQPQNRGEAHLQAITAHLAARYTESVDMKSIASALGLNPRYMMGVFKRMTGMTILEYLHRLRISHARQQLISTDCKIIDVALESGFQSVSAFYAAFQRFGSKDSPRAFRRRNRIS